MSMKAFSTSGAIRFLLRRRQGGKRIISTRTESVTRIRLRHRCFSSNTNQRQWNSSNNKSFSSNAAAALAEVEEEEDEEYLAPIVSTTSSSSATPISSRRPRLESLRQQLRNETKDDSIPNLKVATPPSTSIENQNTDINELLRLLEGLPDPPTGPSGALQDRYGRQHSYLRISLAEKCNLRCLYCMPEDGVPLQPQSHLLTNSEIMSLATWFTNSGVNKIRLTGGEPLLRKDIVDLVGDLHALGKLEQIGMTTNGVTLSKNLPDLVEAGLTHVNISLDSLDADKFAKLTRRPPSYHARVLRAIEDCATYLPYRTKINVVVMPDNVEELQDFALLSKEMPVDIRFIEYMPFNDNNWDTSEFISYQDMQNQIHGLQRIEDGPNDTTKWWTLGDDDTSSKNKNGRIGFITSMSEHFCGTCNRLRLTADGKLKVCLFGKTEINLRDLLRYQQNDQEGDKNDHHNQKQLSKLIHYAVQKKHYKLGGHKDMEDLQQHSTENRPMTLIGG